VESQGLPALLAVAVKISPSGAAQDEHPDPRPMSRTIGSSANERAFEASQRERMPSPRPAVRIIAMSVEPRESGEAARSVCPPNCPQLHFEQGQADRTSPRSPLTSPIPTWNINLSSHSHLKTGRDQLEAFADAFARFQPFPVPPCYDHQGIRLDSSPPRGVSFCPRHAGPTGTFQISSAYSRTARSEQNHPTRAVFRMLACHHAARSRQSLPTSRCLA
jgi:hypothetical protein